MSVAICLISVHRASGDTLACTLDRMRDMDDLSGAKIAVSVGNPASSYAKGLGVEVLETSEEAWSQWGGASTHKGYHLTRNTLRAHRWLARSGAELCVFAEDDVAVSKGWLRRLAMACEAAQSSHVQAGVTACSSHPEWCFAPPVLVEQGLQIRRFNDPLLFWGNQLLAYGARGAAAMAAHLQTCVANWQPPLDKLPAVNSLLFGDQATKTFFHNSRVPLFVTVPSLAQHVGEYRTWCGEEHLSPAFRDHPTARFEDDK